MCRNSKSRISKLHFPKPETRNQPRLASSSALGDNLLVSSISITLNGEPRDIAGALTLLALVESLGMKPDRVAVERNRALAPRSTWADVTLQPGDQLEIVHFVGGGCPSR